MFIGREKELEEIRDSLAKDTYQGIFIYGRRRIGKTELISQALKNVKCRVLSFEFRKTTIKSNLDLFSPVVKEFFDDNFSKFDSFDSIFEYLLMKSVDEEYVLVLDEFSFLLDQNFEIESSLATAIDRYKSKSKIHLIVSGSYIGLMEKMIDNNSHSFGRFNHIIPLHPFEYFTSSKFYPNYSNEDKIMLYSVFGGVPFFTHLIDVNKSALQNVYDLVIKKDSICEHEINEMVMGETSKAPLLNSLLLSIINGKQKYSDLLSDFLAQGKSRPDYFLEKLLDMDFIEKVSPINDENNKKRIYYKIKDNLINFYYRYIFVSISEELRKEPEFYFTNFIKDDFYTKYIPSKFEEISKEFLIRMNFNGRIKPVFYRIGEYFYNNQKEHINRQLDVVTEDKNGFISYECKYKDKPLGIGDVNEEIDQTSNLPDIKFYKLGFISKSGFSSEVDKAKYNLFTLDDFYK